MKVLVVDDSIVQRMILKKILEGGGHSVIEASDGHSALELLGESPDVIVCDILMPGLDGYGLLELLSLRGSAIPVVIASADIASTTQAKCIELGAFGFVQKPYRSDELRAVVVDAFKVREVPDSIAAAIESVLAH